MYINTHILTLKSDTCSYDFLKDLDIFDYNKKEIMAPFFQAYLLDFFFKSVWGINLVHVSN